MLDTVVAAETPEGIVLELHPAGLTVRFYAFLLDWLIRHNPASAGHVISSIIGEAERELHIPRDVSEYSIRVALSLDSELSETAQDEFLGRVFTPAN